jgi:tetratricopeptide (TPR) repeat protein
MSESKPTEKDVDATASAVEGQAIQLGNLGLCYKALDEIPTAIDFFQRSLALDETTGRIEGQADQLDAAHALKARAVALRSD